MPHRYTGGGDSNINVQEAARNPLVSPALAPRPWLQAALGLLPRGSILAMVGSHEMLLPDVLRFANIANHGDHGSSSQSGAPGTVASAAAAAKAAAAAVAKVAGAPAGTDDVDVSHAPSRDTAGAGADGAAAELPVKLDGTHSATTTAAKAGSPAAGCVDGPEGPGEPLVQVQVEEGGVHDFMFLPLPDQPRHVARMAQWLERCHRAWLQPAAQAARK